MIKEEESTKDVGVTVNNKGTFTEHIDSTTKTCLKISGMILRSFHSREKDIMLTLLKVLILPRMDYCSVLWAPFKVEEIRRVEKIQSNFTKHINIPGIKEMDYWTRLKTLNLYSVQRRFERYKIIYVWKILQGLVVNPGIEFNDDLGSRTGLTCKIPKHTMNLREKSFMISGPRLFNSLPKEIRECPLKSVQDSQVSVNHFKSKLDNFLKDIPDEPNLSGDYSKRMQGINNLGERTNSIIRIM